jgi:hypothetical protein
VPRRDSRPPGSFFPVGGLVLQGWQDLDEEGFRTSTRRVGEQLQIAFFGEAETSVRDRIHQLLTRADAEARRLGVTTVCIDFCELGFMSSSCFKAFVTWIDQAKQGGSYRITFVSSERHPWHRRSLSALRGFAPDLVTTDLR